MPSPPRPASPRLRGYRDVGGACIPDRFIDGQRASTPQLRSRDTREVRAVEIHACGMQVPPRFQVLRGDGCGAVVPWTRFAR